MCHRRKPNRQPLHDASDALCWLMWSWIIAPQITAPLGQVLVHIHNYLIKWTATCGSSIGVKQCMCPVEVVGSAPTGTKLSFLSLSLFPFNSTFQCTTPVNFLYASLGFKWLEQLKRYYCFKTINFACSCSMYDWSIETNKKPHRYVKAGNADSE